MPAVSASGRIFIRSAFAPVWRARQSAPDVFPSNRCIISGRRDPYHDTNYVFPAALAKGESISYGRGDGWQLKLEDANS
jgi:hypothetical protein